MKEKLGKLLLLIVLLVPGCLLTYMQSQAQVRDITLYDEDISADWESRYGDEGLVEADELFLPGDTGKLIVQNEQHFWEGEVSRIQYVSTDSSVVQVDQKGNYRILKGGAAVVHVNGWDSKGELVFEASYSFLTGGDVSQMTLGKSSVQGYLFDQDFDHYQPDEMIIPFVHAPDFRYYSLEMISPAGSDTGIDYYLDPEKKALVVTATETGTINLTFKLNKKLFTVKIKVSKVEMKKDSALLAHKGKLRLSVKGYAGKVKWVSTNKKVASVSANGQVRAKKKTGNTVVYAQIGNHRMGCAVSVVTSRLKKVINQAIKIANTCKYSQSKRMSSKYYDCSSLVWKSYRKAGKTFGNKNYAPVAADLAKWCKQKGKLVKGGASTKNIDKMKLRPGDIAFLTGSDNGRYKGIYHVEMFTGYRCYGFNGSKPILSTCWAARYDDYGTGLTLMGRP